MTIKRKAEVLDILLDKLDLSEMYETDEELERFFVTEIGLTDKEIRQLGFYLYE